MTEARPPEDVTCPLLTMALILKGHGGTFEDPLLRTDEPKLKKKIKCLGVECAMFNTNFRGCGLRVR